MSHEEREETGNLLRRIGGERTVVVVEHDMDFMRAFANPEVQEVYLGTAAAGVKGIPVELIEESS
jgi:urea transport system ATP-binding protein